MVPLLWKIAWWFPQKVKLKNGQEYAKELQAIQIDKCSLMSQEPKGGPTLTPINRWVGNQNGVYLHSQ